MSGVEQEAEAARGDYKASTQKVSRVESEMLKVLC